MQATSRLWVSIMHMGFSGSHGRHCGDIGLGLGDDYSMSKPYISLFFTLSPQIPGDVWLLVFLRFWLVTWRTGLSVSQFHAYADRKSRKVDRKFPRETSSASLLMVRW